MRVRLALGIPYLRKGLCLGSEAMIGIVRLAFPLDLGLGWYTRVGTVYRVCVILVFEYTVIKKSRQQESDANI